MKLNVLENFVVQNFVKLESLKFLSYMSWTRMKSAENCSKCVKELKSDLPIGKHESWEYSCPEVEEWMEAIVSSFAGGGN